MIKTNVNFEHDNFLSLCTKLFISAFNAENRVRNDLTIRNIEENISVQ